jgi:hypothetical protein
VQRLIEVLDIEIVKPPKRLAALLTKTEQLPVKDVERITTGGAREPATNRWKSAAEAHEDPW